jgi:hypothetical protein
MRKYFIFLVFTLLCSEIYSQQLVIKLNEGFENTTFPPTGWRKINIMGANQWQRLTAPLPTIIMQPPIQGIAVARIDLEYTGGDDWLITKKINSIESGDSLLFYLIKQYSDGPFSPDSMLIKVSTTDSNYNSFLNTLLKINIAGIPVGNQVWHRYSLPLSQFAGQNIFIAFEHKDNNGHGCAIDSIVVFNPNSIGISVINRKIPDGIKLYQNYPNPFNPSTNIKFQIPNTCFVKLKVYDMLGKEIATLVNENLTAGLYVVPFSISQFSINQISSGVYFYKLETKDYSGVNSMILIK